MTIFLIFVFLFLFFIFAIAVGGLVIVIDECNLMQITAYLVFLIVLGIPTYFTALAIWQRLII